MTDDEGRYEIGGVPAGAYAVSVWNEGSERDRRGVTSRGLPGGGGEVDFTVG